EYYGIQKRVNEIPEKMLELLVRYYNRTVFKKPGDLSLDTSNRRYFKPFLEYRAKLLGYEDPGEYVRDLLDFKAYDGYNLMLENEYKYIFEKCMYDSAKIAPAHGTFDLREETAQALPVHLNNIIKNKNDAGKKEITIKVFGVGTDESPEVLDVLNALIKTIPDPQEWSVKIYGYDIKTENLNETERSIYGAVKKLPFSKVNIDFRYCDLKDEKQYEYIFNEKCDIAIYRNVATAGSIPKDSEYFKTKLTDSLNDHGILIYNDYDFEKLMIKEGENLKSADENVFSGRDVQNAQNAGREIFARMMTEGKYTLLINKNVFSKKVIESDKWGYEETDGSKYIGYGDICNVKGINNESMASILGAIETLTADKNSLFDPAKTIIQIDEHQRFSEEEIDELKRKAPGIRMLRIDTSSACQKININQKMIFRKQRFDMYAMLLAARSVTKEDLAGQNNSIYRTLYLYLNSHNPDLDKDPEDIIKALLRGDIAKTIKYVLSLKPMNQWVKETDLFVITQPLLSA
ncbi:MAG: hypothetical protein HQL29_05615, partial [Candidatus Omnitrophica bacterium]|nr:hypothetical protein [Candidatus Omnitrophota bacterium]